MTYPDSVRRAGFEGEGATLGEALFEAILARPPASTFTVDDYDETWRGSRRRTGGSQLAIADAARRAGGLGDERRGPRRPRVPVRALRRRAPLVDRQHDLPRSGAGARRTSRVRCGCIPTTPPRLGLADGDRARITTKRGSAVAIVEVTDTLQAGHVSLPNGLGPRLPGRRRRRRGPAWRPTS